MTQINEENVTGTKWEILKKLEKKPLSPKQIAEKTNSTTANISLQLKLLEAYGYVKKKKIDKGKGSRKDTDTRVLYSIAKNTYSITSITPNNVSKKEIKPQPFTSLIANLLLNDLQEEAPPLLKLALEKEELFKEIDSLFYIKTESAPDGKEIHLFVITDALEKFRGQKSKIELKTIIPGSIPGIRFWSHTLQETITGLTSKEPYFINQAKTIKLLYEKKPGISSQIIQMMHALEDSNE